MRSARNGLVAGAAVLSILAGACGTKDATGPNITLSLEEVSVLGQELAAVMGGPVVFSPPAVAGPVARRILGRVLGAATPFNFSWNCALGGSASVASTYDTTATQLSGDATLSYSSCKTAHYTTTGSFHANGTDTITGSSETLHLTAGGSLDVTALDGRSGVCPIDITVNATGSTGANPVVTVTGSACGVTLTGTY